MRTVIGRPPPPGAVSSSTGIPGLGPRTNNGEHAALSSSTMSGAADN